MMKRQHRIAILKYLKGNIWLLIIPLIRGLLSLDEDLYSWFKMVYMDIIVIAIMFGYAWLKWYFVQFKISKKEIYVKKGIIFQNEIIIPYSVISCMTVHVPFLLRPFRAVKITFDTESDIRLKKHTLAYLVLIVSETDYTQIYQNIPAEKSKAKIKFQASKREIVLYSIFFSTAIPSLVYVGIFIIQSSRIVGKKFEMKFLSVINELTESLKNYFDRIIAIVVTALIIVAVGWIMSFVIKILRHLNFKISRYAGNIMIEKGYFSYWKYYVNYSRINNVDICQNLLMKIANKVSVHINCSGYVRRKNEQAVLIPMTTRRIALHMIKALFPNFTICNIQLKSKRTYIMVYIWLPLVLIIGVAVATVVLCKILYKWDDAVRFVGIMLEIPLAYLLVVRIVAKNSTGIGVNDRVVTINYCRATRFYTAIVPKERVAYVKIRRTFFQRVSGCCDVIVYARGGHVRGYRVRGIVLTEALWLVDNYDKMCQNAHL